MKNALNDYRLLEKWNSAMGGVYSLGDLKNLLNESNPVVLYRRINTLIENKALIRFRREFYLTQQYDIEVLSQRVYPDSYISFGNVLARHALIGAIPMKTVHAVKKGRSRTFGLKICTLEYRGIAPHLFFGFTYEKGIRYALPEKAFLDTLYFYQKGSRFSFNIIEDIDRKRIDGKKVLTMLKNYKNPKFAVFVKGVLSGGN